MELIAETFLGLKDIYSTLVDVLQSYLYSNTGAFKLFLQNIFKVY